MHRNLVSSICVLSAVSALTPARPALLNRWADPGVSKGRHRRRDVIASSTVARKPPAASRSVSTKKKRGGGGGGDGGGNGGGGGGGGSGGGPSAWQAFRDFNFGSWTGVATVYDTFGLRIGKPLDYTLNLCTSAEAAATSEKASSDAKQAPSSSSENVLETWVWSSATTGSSSAEGNERKSPEQTSTWEVSPSACSMDVDPIDGSYSLDRGKGDGSDGAGPLLAHILNPKDLAQALGSEMGGEGSSSSSALGGELGIGRCIEHAIAMDDRTRMRCVCVFARGDGRPLAVVQLNETRVGEYTGPAADASVLSGMSTSSILAGSSSAGPGNGGGDIEELEVAFPIVSLDVLAQAPWVGEMTLRNYKSDKSKVGSGLKFNSGTKSVAKLELLYNWANVNFLPKKTTIRAGFGAQANEEESFWTDGRLNEHPLWGLNSRCVEYDGGDSMVLLGGGCAVSLPPTALLTDGPAFRTEFSVLLQTVGDQEEESEARRGETANGGEVQDAVVVGEEEPTSQGHDESRVKTHLARSQRIYVNGQLSTASSAFLTAGGLPYR